MGGKRRFRDRLSAAERGRKGQGIGIGFGSNFGVHSDSITAVDGGSSGSPLVIQLDSRIVALNYEVWFGPKLLHFDGSHATPVLSSQSMRAIGKKGYDSADPAIIRKHVAWFEELGIDAVVADGSNQVAAVRGAKSDAEWVAKRGDFAGVGGTRPGALVFARVRDPFFRKAFTGTGPLWPVRGHHSDQNDFGVSKEFALSRRVLHSDLPKSKRLSLIRMVALNPAELVQFERLLLFHMTK